MAPSRAQVFFGALFTVMTLLLARVLWPGGWFAAAPAARRAARDSEGSGPVVGEPVECAREASLLEELNAVRLREKHAAARLATLERWANPVDPALADALLPKRAELEADNKAAGSKCSVPSPTKCRIGDYETLWTRKDMLDEIPSFAQAYASRPIKVNVGGMRINHQFGLWFTLRHFGFKHVIESGVHNGQGSWLIRQALPDVDLWCFDPGTASKITKDAADHVFMGKPEHRGTFINWTRIDWEAEGVDKDRTLIVWDDHTDMYTRLGEMVALGFTHLWVEDNYHSCHGSSSSPKLFCDATAGLLPNEEGRGGKSEAGVGMPAPNATLLWDKHNYMDKYLSHRVFSMRRREFLRWTNVYREIPPIHFSLDGRVNPHEQGTKFPESVARAIMEDPIFETFEEAKEFHPPLGDFSIQTEYHQYEYCAYIRLNKDPTAV